MFVISMVMIFYVWGFGFCLIVLIVSSVRVCINGMEVEFIVFRRIWFFDILSCVCWLLMVGLGFV